MYLYLEVTDCIHNATLLHTCYLHTGSRLSVHPGHAKCCA